MQRGDAHPVDVLGTDANRKCFGPPEDTSGWSVDGFVVVETGGFKGSLQLLGESMTLEQPQPGGPSLHS